MVVLAEEVKPVNDGRVRRTWVLPTVTLLMVAVFLGCLGWLLPSPGGSLVIPTLIVFTTGCALGAIDWIVVGSWRTVIAVVAITVVASLWTFAFSVPASLGLDSAATSQAQTALVQLATSERNQYGIPLHPCSTRVTGSVGPIGAPYRQCAVSTPEGHFVIFTSGGQTARGIGYTDIGAATFPDECSRHLVGKWWMFTGTTSGTGGCPFGYQFHGGG